MSQDLEVEFEQRPEDAVVDGDLRVEMRLKNNRLWEPIYDRFGTVAAFCKGEKGMSQCEVGRLINLKCSPFRVVKGWQTGEYREVCLRIATKLELPPEYLFPDELYEKFVGKETTGAVTVSSLNIAEVDYKSILLAPAPEESGISEFDFSELREKLDEVLKTLQPRLRLAIELRHGLNGNEEHTFEEIGKKMRVGLTRAMQVYNRAIRELQVPYRAKKIEGLL